MPTLQCSVCPFLHLSLGRIVAHQKLHSGPFFCGIDTCQFVANSQDYLRKHVSDVHADIYPTGDYSDLAFGEGSFVKIYPGIVGQAEIPLPMPAEYPHVSDDFAPPSPDPASPAPHNFAENEAAIDRKVNQFLNILASNGAKIPFKTLKSISDSLVDFFYDVQE